MKFGKHTKFGKLFWYPFWKLVFMFLTVLSLRFRTQQEMEQIVTKVSHNLIVT